MVYENRIRFKKMLKSIEINPMKVLTNQHFTSDQWIQYNLENKYFEYEDGAFLGNTPADVTSFFFDILVESKFGEWIRTASWFVKEKTN